MSVCCEQTWLMHSKSYAISMCALPVAKYGNLQSLLFTYHAQSKSMTSYAMAIHTSGSSSVFLPHTSSSINLRDHTVI